MGYIKLPSLRERKDDIMDLMNYFISIETTQSIKISKEVEDYLLRYDWHGNIRELINTLSYMLAVREGSILTLRDVPHREFFRDSSPQQLISQEKAPMESMELDDCCAFILGEIQSLHKKGLIAGRKLISEGSLNQGCPMTISQVRTKMDKLEELGLIQRKKGRFGTVLTSKGKMVLKEKD